MKTKEMGVFCMSAYLIGFVVGLLLVSVPGVSAEGINLVTNGNFSDELTGWTFTDNSISRGWTEVHEVEDRARIQVYGKYSRGMLYQTLTEKVVPTYFSADFELKCHHGEALVIELCTSNMYTISYWVDRKNDGTLWARSYFLGQRYTYAIDDGTTYDKGNYEMRFDYDTGELKIYINGNYKNTFDLPTEVMMPTVDQVMLTIRTRDEMDAQGYFDNIVLEGEKECISTVVGSDSKGVLKDIFMIGDDMYCFGEGFVPDRYVRMYVVEHQDTWVIGDSLVDTSGMYERIHTDEWGEFHPDLIWEAVSTEGTYDIVVDTNQNAKWDCCEPMDTVIIESTEIPEFTSVAVPLVLILAMFLVFSRKRKKE